MAFDEGGVYYAFQGDEDQQDLRPRAQTIADFKDFITKFYPANQQQTFIYRDKLMKNHLSLEVDLVHVREFNQELGDGLENKPAEYLPLFERAAKEVLQEDHQLTSEGEEQAFEDVQVLLFSSQPFGPQGMRSITSARVSQLVQISGIVTSASKQKHKASYLTVQCKECRATQVVPCKPGLGGALLPRRCETVDPVTNQACPPNSWVVLGERSRYVDQQTLKLQERPEDIPTGELPRTLLMVVDRHLVGRVTPGSRLVVTGIYCTHRSQAMDKGPSNITLQLPYLRVVDLQEESEAHADDTFSNAERQAFLDMSHDPDIITKIAASIAPKIKGQDDIKMAIACLLFGGSRKIMPDGTARRGDINVLLLGDPSVGKSQFLKFVSKVAPICVYTSGKGSSAAGLTAAVVQDASSREFFLEGGAMVLADGGVVCIDEFDKMRPEDRVAIHEAMEQQTISISKAGIQATLNARTSILAAANPLYGRYDKTKTLKQNINLPPAILSRFDLLHVMLDELTEEEDGRIAAHIVALHKDPAATISRAPFTMEQLQRYIKYARAIKPRLTAAAQSTLVRSFKRLRGDDAAPGSHSAYRITVRQLEALVRLSEAMARVYLSPTVTGEHVAEAAKLLKASILKVDVSDLEMDEDDYADIMAEQQGRAELDEMLQQHNVPQEQQQQQDGGDAEMHDAYAEQQENVPPPEDGDANVRQPQSQQGKQQQEQGKQQTQQQQQESQQQRRTTSISAEKYEFIKNMLLRRLWEIQQEQERQAAAAGEAAAAAAGMEVEGEEAAVPPAPREQRAGVVQKELVEWYMQKQLERNAISSVQAAEVEFELAYKVINHMYRKEGLVSVVGAPKRQAGEDDDSYRNRLWKERRLTLSPNFVPE